MTQDEADAFARDWIEAWNSHDLQRILSHYADEVVFLSPVAQQRVGNGRLTGVPALRAYWGAGLKAQPTLRFELVDVLVGHGSATLLYRNHKGQTVAETAEFGPTGKVVRAYACYTSGTPAP